METHKEMLLRWDLVSNHLAAGWAGLAGGSMVGRTSVWLDLRKIARPEAPQCVSRPLQGIVSPHTASLGFMKHPDLVPNLRAMAP